MNCFNICHCLQESGCRAFLPNSIPVQGSILRSRTGSISEDFRDDRLPAARPPTALIHARGMSGISRPSYTTDPPDLNLSTPVLRGARRPFSHHGAAAGPLARPPSSYGLPGAPPAAAAAAAARARAASAGRAGLGGAGGAAPATEASAALALSAKLDSLALRLRTVDARAQILRLRLPDEVTPPHSSLPLPLPHRTYRIYLPHLPPALPG